MSVSQGKRQEASRLTRTTGIFTASVVMRRSIFTFIAKLENVSFPEGGQGCCYEECGIAMPKRKFGSAEEARDAGMRRRLIDIHEAATMYFEAQLKSARRRFDMHAGISAGRGVAGGYGCEVPHWLRTRRLQPHARAAPRAFCLKTSSRASRLFQFQGAGRWKPGFHRPRPVSQAHYLSHRQ